MADQLRLTKDDFDGDAVTFSWDVVPESGEADFAAWDTKLAALATEINKWCAGRDHRTQYVVDKDDNGVGKASSPVAQAHIRIILEGEDAVTGQVYRFPIAMAALNKAADGGADPAFIAQGQGSNSLTVMNPAHADYALLKTQFELTAQSPNGNDVLLVRGYVEE